MSNDTLVHGLCAQVQCQSCGKWIECKTVIDCGMKVLADYLVCDDCKAKYAFDVEWGEK